MIVLINMVTTLMMSANMATPGLLKIKFFWNKGYDVIMSVHDVTNKILSRNSNYIVDMVMWPKWTLATCLLHEYDMLHKFYWLLSPNDVFYLSFYITIFIKSPYFSLYIYIYIFFKIRKTIKREEKKLSTSRTQSE